MSNPVGTEWILRVDRPASDGFLELDAYLREFAGRRLTNKQVASLEILDHVRDSGSPDASGQQTVSLLVGVSGSGESAFEALLREVGFDAQKNLALRPIKIAKAPGAGCPAIKAPLDSPDAAGVHVAVIGNVHVKSSALLLHDVHRFDVTNSEVTKIIDPIATDDSHSTDMALVMAHKIHGPARRAELWSYRLAKRGGAWQMLRALKDVVARRQVRVVCVASDARDQIPNDYFNELRCLEAFIRNMSTDAHNPVIFVAAAGNKDSTMTSPATAPFAVTVGAIDGPTLMSTVGLGRSMKPNFVARGGTVKATQCVEWTTSMSAPFVAGCIATWFTIVPDLKYEEVMQVLETSHDPPPEADPLKYGRGIFNGVKALEKVRELKKLRETGQTSRSVPAMAQSVQSAE